MKRVIAFFLATVFLAGVVAASWPGLYLPSLDFVFESAGLTRDARVQSTQAAVVRLTVLARPEDSVSRPMVQRTGTGFNIHPAGVIITNHHVLRDAVRIVITFPGGEIHNARGWTGKPDWDLAVVELEETTQFLPAARLGDPGKTRPGGEILVIGHPLGLEHIVIRGTLGRTVRLPDFGAPALELHAPIHPGHSGSPVLDQSGRVIAVVFAGLSDGDETRGLALPADYIREFLASRDTNPD